MAYSKIKEFKLDANPRWTPIQDGHQSKMASYPRWMSIQNGCQSKMATNPRLPSIQDGHQSKMAINPRWPPIQDLPIQDDLHDGQYLTKIGQKEGVQGAGGKVGG